MADATKKIADREKIGRWLMLIAVFASFAAYHLFNRPDDELLIMVTRFDAATPFVPAFSVPYLLYLPFVVFTLVYGVAKTPFWRQVGTSFLLNQCMALAMYALYQSHVPRPELAGDGAFMRLVAFIYATDKPYNTFPSLHVAHSLVCLFWWHLLLPRYRAPAAFLVGAIIMSTLVLKQHVIVDVVGAFALATVSILLAFRIWRQTKTKRTAAPAAVPASTTP